MVSGVWPLDPTTPASSKVAEVATAHFGLHRTALAYCVAMAAFVAVGGRQLDAPRTRPGHRQTLRVTFPGRGEEA
jgi:hypothetical protein